MEPILCMCNVCEKKHQGIFYHCFTCSRFNFHHNCMFLPNKLLIQDARSDGFSHTHPLTLSYSLQDQYTKFNPRCRVCDEYFSYLSKRCRVLYKCSKCRYYAHVDCATSRGEPFMSIFLPAGRGKIHKNFKDGDYPDLLRLPFADESCSILRHRFSSGESSRSSEKNSHGNDSLSLTHFSHVHPLVLVDEETSSSTTINSVSLHNPMKKIQLLCNGCVRPITNVPFYKCAKDYERCNFVLHKWCTQLPNQVQNHPSHPEHTLVFLTNIPRNFFGVFFCKICRLRCNGFAYGCSSCKFYIDVNCGFIPETITHQAHPYHLLLRTRIGVFPYCIACDYRILENELSFRCGSCDIYVHTKCALLLPKEIRHKYDKHPLSLRYSPVENHKSEYFCENCEEEFNPKEWFYHCSECAQSMHSDCAPLILQSEQASQYWLDRQSVYKYLNIKFGGTLDNVGFHPHPLSFVQGIRSDGQCTKCIGQLNFRMIFKCLKCKFALHYECASRLRHRRVLKKN